MIDPPRDYSVYDMSWVGPAASLISTVADLNRFFGLLLAGEIVSPSSLAQMQRTVPVISLEGKTIDYGLGLHTMEVPGHGTFWGHDGTVWGAGAMAMTRADGKRQMSVAVNLRGGTSSTPRAGRSPIPSTTRLRLFTAWRCAADRTGAMAAMAGVGVAEQPRFAGVRSRGGPVRRGKPTGAAEWRRRGC